MSIIPCEYHFVGKQNLKEKNKILRKVEAVPKEIRVTLYARYILIYRRIHLVRAELARIKKVLKNITFITSCKFYCCFV